MSEKEARRLLVGKIQGVLGLQGWVKVFSHTRPRENIYTYQPWQLKRGGQWQSVKPVQGRTQSKTIVVKLEGVDSIEQAEALLGSDIYIDRDQLPQSSEQDYYWTDLEGCSVITTEGQELGKVSYLMETGSNDVLVVKGDKERLIPFLPDDVVTKVDLQNRIIEVDWDPDF